LSARKDVFVGVALMVVYTGAISFADAITKHIASGFAAPQLFAVSGLVVAALCLVAGRPFGSVPRTRFVGHMVVRCALGVAASIAFFSAFRELAMAEVFLFVGLMPIISAALSGPVLGERFQVRTWIALCIGVLGVFCLFPRGIHDFGVGHLAAGVAVLSGSLSLVLARFATNRENQSLAQVFYPNLTLGLVMCVALPFVWRPMSGTEWALVGAYSVALFVARWLSILALKLLPVHVVTMLMSLQFVWMVWMDATVFGVATPGHVYFGAFIVTGAGTVLVWQRMLPQRTSNVVT
jgi:drug/metabolite transporter (DMT)-like permease